MNITASYLHLPIKRHVFTKFTLSITSHLTSGLFTVPSRYPFLNPSSSAKTSPSSDQGSTSCHSSKGGYSATQDYLNFLHTPKEKRCPRSLRFSPLHTDTQIRRWLAAVRALANLSILDPNAIGLDKYSPHSDYFPRQIRSLTKVSEAQAKVRDVETGKAVGTKSFKDTLRIES